MKKVHTSTGLRRNYSDLRYWLNVYESRPSCRVVTVDKDRYYFSFPYIQFFIKRNESLDRPVDPYMGLPSVRLMLTCSLNSVEGNVEEPLRFVLLPNMGSSDGQVCLGGEYRYRTKSDHELIRDFWDIPFGGVDGWDVDYYLKSHNGEWQQDWREQFGEPLSYFSWNRRTQLHGNIATLIRWPIICSYGTFLSRMKI